MTVATMGFADDWCAEVPATRVAPVVDELHGVQVTDRYRWLEATDAPEVREWVDAQNRYTRTLLDAAPARTSIRSHLEQLLSIGTLGTPSVRRDRYFYTRRDGTQNQPVLYVRDGLRGTDRVAVDPNAFAADGTVAIDWYHPSPSGKLLAFGTSASGSEQSVLHLLDVDSGRRLPDEIRNTRACSIAWKPDESGFYYTRYPSRGEVPSGEEHYHRRVFFHARDSDSTSDPLIFGTGRHPQDWPNVDISPDGRWLLVTVSQGWSKTEMYVRDLGQSESTFATVVEKTDALFTGDIQNDRLYIHTNLGAERYRVVVTEPAAPGHANWRELIAESDDVLEGVEVVGGRLFCHYLHDASSRLVEFSLQGTLARRIALPTLGSIYGLGGEWNGHELLVGFHSFAMPPAVHQLDFASGKLTLWEQVSAPIDSARYEIRQVRFTSRDGTSVPMFVLSKRDAVAGPRPTLLYGYGGFNVNLTPAFSRSLPMWMDAGGVYAVANLRGGGEFGEAWHRGGMLANKQNVFDDFIAAAEWLIRDGTTTPNQLAIMGGSNGGLLVSAVATQRPELFRAVVCQVPLCDMLRYHEFQIAKLWIPEYGSAADAEQFRWLYAYSPYHRVRDQVAQPAWLIATAESDTRVDPMHARKMAARLQAATSSRHPVLLRVETKAGHGAGKPLRKTIDEQTDVWTFLCWQLGVEPKRKRD